MPLARHHYVLLALMAFLLALPGRMSLPPLDRDEPRYMEATEQMLTSGNFLDIRFQNQPRYLQPAGIYWLEAASATLARTIAGPDVLREPWPYRLPSLLAASIVVPLVAWMGTVLFSGETGLLAALFLTVSTLFVAESHMATIDTVLLLDILITEALLLRCFQDRNAGRNTPCRVACFYWLSVGIGLMLKGPIVLIPALGTPLALCLVERSQSTYQNSLWPRLRPQWGWLLSLAVVLPWGIAITLVSHGDFLANAIGHNLLGKVAHAQESHGFLPGYYLTVFLLTFWPGSFFAIRAIPAIWHERKAASVRFLLCWIIPHWLFFELLATKLPHYVLPIYPAIAILTAAALTVWPTPKLPSWGKGLMGLYSVLWAAVGLIFCCAGTFYLAVWEHHLSLRESLALLGSLPLMIAALVLLWQQKARAAASCAIGTAMITQAGLFLAVIPHMSLIQLSPRLVHSFEQYRPCTGSTLISTSYSEPSLVFLAGEKTQLLSPIRAAHALHDHARCTLALVDRKDETAFRKALNTLGMDTVEYDRIGGLNYSTGHWLDLRLYAGRRKDTDNP